jgi:hypothetical protein
MNEYYIFVLIHATIHFVFFGLHKIYNPPYYDTANIIF